MDEQESENSFELVDIGRYLRLLWKWWWLVVLAAVFTGEVAFIATRLVTPVYQAKTTILINAMPSSGVADYGTIQLNLQLSQTYSQMITTTPILAEVAQRLGLSVIDPATITAEAATNLAIINITVEASDPALAAMIANTLVTVFREQAQALEMERYAVIEQNLQTQITETDEMLQMANRELNSTVDEAQIDLINVRIDNYEQTYLSLVQSLEDVRLSQAESVTSIVQIEPAAPPAQPSSPKGVQYVAIAAVLGVFLAARAIYLLAITDRSLKTPDEFSQKLGLPVIGTIVHYRSDPGKPIIEADPLSPAAEAFRALRTHILFLGSKADSPLKTIMIVSPLAEEGKTATAVNLGIAFAQTGRQVCLLDANLRSPDVHNLLQLSNRSGLSQALTKTDADLAEMKFIKKTRVANLHAVTSGKALPYPSETLSSAEMCNLVNEIKAGADMVIIDTPQALDFTDASVLLPYVDGVLLVMKAGAIGVEPARRLVQQLRMLDAHILGIVVNHLPGAPFRRRLNLFKRLGLARRHGKAGGFSLAIPFQRVVTFFAGLIKKR